LNKHDNDELIADVQLESAAALQTPALWSQAIARGPNLGLASAGHAFCKRRGVSSVPICNAMLLQQLLQSGQSRSKESQPSLLSK